MRPARAIVEAQLDRLPVLPAVAQHLIESLDDPDVRTDTLAKDITIDPVLAGRVIRAANSAFYAPPQPLDTLDKALRYLGFAQVRSIVLTSVLTAQMQVPGQNLAKFWRRSLRTAVYAKTLAGWIDAPDESAYLLGIVHDIGYLVLSMAAPEEMSAIAAEHEGRALQLAAEHKTIGCSSLAVTASLLRTWGFPNNLTFALELDDAHSLGHSEGCLPLGPLGTALHVARSIAAGDTPTQGLDVLALEDLTHESVQEALLDVDTSRFDDMINAG